MTWHGMMHGLGHENVLSIRLRVSLCMDVCYLVPKKSLAVLHYIRVPIL